MVQVRTEDLGHGVAVIFRVVLFTADVGVHGAADSQAALNRARQTLQRRQRVTSSTLPSSHLRGCAGRQQADGPW